MFATIAQFLHDLWILVRPYWRSEERWRSGVLLAVIVVLNLAAVYVNVLINRWNRLFYNALQALDFRAFVHQFLVFGGLAAAFIVVAVYRVYLRQMLEIRWRRWLTRRYVGEWLDDRSYYRLQLARGQVAGGPADNPDQRISEDIAGFTGQTLILSLGLLDSVVTLASFAAILWTLSGSVTLWGVTIPGYMLWAAVIYAVFGSWAAHRIGRRLIGLNYRQQQVEADFRFALVRLRENAEGVALYGGEGEETRGLVKRFAQVVENWWGIMRQQKRLTWFSAGYGQLAMVFPFIVAAPRYFAQTIHLGGLMQIAFAFGQVQGALSWFVDAYVGLAAWKATVDRLIGFEGVLAAGAGGSPRRICRTDAAPGDAVAVEDLTLDLPDGTPLARVGTLRFAPGERVLIAGPSGCGKSTLFRAVAGLWPYGHGRVSLPASERLLFLPQKPYLPIATLREAVAYPDSPETYAEDAVRAVLAACGLAHLGRRLDQVRHWGQRLSPGEQQRLAVARALLLRPRWLFLDEATSNLDEEGETALYRLLAEKLPGTALVSIAHRSGVGVFHHRRIGFARLPGASPPCRVVADDLPGGK